MIPLMVLNMLTIVFQPTGPKQSMDATRQLVYHKPLHAAEIAVWRQGGDQTVASSETW